MYLVMVGVMVGLNYRLRGRQTSGSVRASSANSNKSEAVAGGDEADEPEPEPVVRAASVCFSEEKGSYSSLVSAETWTRDNLDQDCPPSSASSRPRLVEV